MRAVPCNLCRRMTTEGYAVWSPRGAVTCLSEGCLRRAGGTVGWELYRRSDQMPVPTARPIRRPRKRARPL